MTTAQRTDDPQSGTRFYTYPPTGEQFVSVTTAAGAACDKSLYLAPWYGRRAAAFAVDHLDLVAQMIRDGKRDDALTLISGQAPGERDRKAAAGSYVHAVAEALVLWAASPEGTGADIVLPLLPDELAGAEYDDQPLADVTDAMVTGFLNFVTDWQPEFEAAEMTVFNPGLRYAGTLDMILRLKNVAAGPAGRLVPAPGGILTVCVDIKTGRYPGETVREQIAGYRNATEALLPMGDLVPMPHTDASAVLHLRPHYRRGYRVTLLSGEENAGAWQRFRADVDLFWGRLGLRDKPGKVIYPPRPDGSIPQPYLEDLDGEGYGRALSPLIKAGVTTLEQLAALDAGDCLAVKGVAGKVLEVIRRMLADHGLHLRGETPPQEEVA